MGDIRNPQSYQIARAQFAVDGKIEQCNIPGPVRDLQSNPDRPDLPQLEWRLMPDQSALVPRRGAHRACSGFSRRIHGLFPPMWAETEVWCGQPQHRAGEAAATESWVTQYG
jgi:hypothetical protein